MTRRYEVVYIFNSSLEEAQVDERLARYHALLKSEENPEPVEQVNHWGKRSLAYPIKGSEVGHYVVAHFATESMKRQSRHRLPSKTRRPPRLPRSRKSQRGQPNEISSQNLPGV
jgi:ribosomal protein S6